MTARCSTAVAMFNRKQAAQGAPADTALVEVDELNPAEREVLAAGARRYTLLLHEMGRHLSDERAAETREDLRTALAALAAGAPVRLSYGAASAARSACDRVLINKPKRHVETDTLVEGLPFAVPRELFGWDSPVVMPAGSAARMLATLRDLIEKLDNGLERHPRWGS
jgi:hypothetical protein